MVFPTLQQNTNNKTAISHSFKRFRHEIQLIYTRPNDSSKLKWFSSNNMAQVSRYHIVIVTFCVPHDTVSYSNHSIRPLSLNKYILYTQTRMHALYFFFALSLPHQVSL